MAHSRLGPSSIADGGGAGGGAVSVAGMAVVVTIFISA